MKFYKKMPKEKKNHITIAKAIGIILMVIGHSGTPFSQIDDFIYLFHMPLFFFCSGYFFKEIYDSTHLQQFCFRRFSGLYIPYIRWSLAFLIFHNLFYNLHLYNFSYNMNAFLLHSIKTIAMTEYEIMLRPFWFLKALLYASLFAGFLSYTYNKCLKKNYTQSIILITLIITLLLKLVNFQLPILGDCSLITLGIVYIYSGHYYRKYESCLHINSLVLVVLVLILLIASICYKGIIDMRYTTITNIIPYYCLSILGIVLVLEISIKIQDRFPRIIKNALYYIGNNTMPILALHLLAFKVGNYMKILIFDLSIEKLSDHTIIPEYNDSFWLVYVLLGVTLPLLSNYLFNNKFQYRS